MALYPPIIDRSVTAFVDDSYTIKFSPVAAEDETIFWRARDPQTGTLTNEATALELSIDRKSGEIIPTKKNYFPHENVQEYTFYNFSNKILTRWGYELALPAGTYTFSLKDIVNNTRGYIYLYWTRNNHTIDNIPRHLLEDTEVLAPIKLTVETGDIIYCVDAWEHDSENSQSLFDNVTITTNKNFGNIWQVSLQLVKDGEKSAWSESIVIQDVIIPTIIANASVNNQKITLNIINQNFNDNPLKSYSYILKKNNGEILDYSDVIYNSNLQSYTFDYILDDNDLNGTIEIDYYTVRGYHGIINSVTWNYSSIKEHAIENPLFSLKANPIEKTKVSLFFTGIYIPSPNNELANLLNYSFQRKNTQGQWITIFEDQIGHALNDGYQKEYLDEDPLLEFGISIEYRVSFNYQINGVSEVNAYVSTNPIYLIPEDYYLISSADQYAIRFNPDLTSYKYTVSDQITQTLGFQYPFVRRNGNMKYRQFNIGGLISYHWNSDEFGNYDNEILKEREFRDKLIEFLYADDVKLFKSAQEGNILVHLTNISLTPNKQLGRNIYSFTAQAIEVADCNEENLIKYGLKK